MNFAATAVTILPRTRRSAVALAAALAVLTVTLLGSARPVQAAVPAVSSAADLVAQVMLAPAGIQREENRPAADEIPALPPAPSAAERTPASDEPVVFADVDGTELVLPGDVRTVGFHQGPQAGLPLVPTGELEKNLNVYKDPPASSGGSAHPYYVLGSRNRGTGATTAVDLSIEQGKELVSPVTGTVQTVQEYSLYGKTPDVIVEIIPEGRPDQLIRVMHVEDVVVEPGDKVEAGETPMAESARLLPFPSQIDRLAGRHPHVHLEAQQRVK